MKLPHHIASVSLALALAACSGAQTGVAPNMLPSSSGGNSGGGGVTHYSVPGSSTPSMSNAQHPTAAKKTTSALILVANEGGGNGGTFSEFSESANGNVAPTTDIANHNGGPPSVQRKASRLRTATSTRPASSVPKRSR